jgi:hypothetical protein
MNEMYRTHDELQKRIVEIVASVKAERVRCAGCLLHTLCCLGFGGGGGACGNLVSEALRYKPEGRGFDFPDELI